MSTLKPVEWAEETLRIIDQTLLPVRLEYRELQTAEQVWEAIRALRVRGAPAIGVCAAFGVVVALKTGSPASISAGREMVAVASKYLGTSRPTAVNLFWALERMEGVAAKFPEAGSISSFCAALETEAIAIFEEDLELGRAIGRHGAALIQDGAGILTHCNAGGLATSGYGTALAPMFVAYGEGTRFRVYADETRPLLQGARLTAWELVQQGIDVTVICDSAAAHLMQQEKIGLVIVGADRIAANGDAANKIGTYGVAVLAKAHKIPFYVAAPYSTFDFSLSTGESIPIEERDAGEIAAFNGRPVVPAGARIYNPAFDVTPHHLLSGIITERGILSPPFSNLSDSLQST